MRKLMSICFLWITVFAYSQEKQFKRSYNYFSIYENGEWGEHEEGINTFVFNVGDGGDVIHYTASGKRLKYTKVSSIKTGKNDDGDEYQYMMILDDEGYERLLMLYDNGVLKIVFDENLQVQFDQ